MTELYKIKTHGEWANIFLDEETGTFSAVTSFGNFGYIWNCVGDRSLKQFLTDVDSSYFFKKAHVHNGRRFDGEATAKKLVRRILENLDDGCIGLGDSVLLVQHANELSDANSEGELLLSLNSELNDFLDGDYCDLISTVTDPQCLLFWKIIWPVFLSHMDTAIRLENQSKETQ